LEHAVSGTRTPISDGILRARYGLPNGFDFSTVQASPFSFEFSLEQIGAEFKRKAEAEQEKEAARQKALDALRPPEIVPKFIKTANYLAADRRISGIASSGAINSHGYALHPGGCKIILPIPLLVGHDLKKCIGSIECAEITAEGKIRVWANIDDRCDDSTWQRIRSGILGCFSGAGDLEHAAAPITIHGVDNYYDWRLKEVSICETGANHECVVTGIWPLIDEAQPSEIVGRVEQTIEPAAINQADVVQSINELADTLRLPVKPIYDKAGKLIGAQRVDKSLELLEARLAAVESRPGTLYRGVWTANEAYETSDLVTHKGSLWVCIDPTKARPGECTGWKLCVKKGSA
jgi:hypothetical protein